MFSSKNRLRKQKDIDLVFKTGQSSFDAAFGVKAKENGLENSRFTVIVGIKTAKKATQRNYIKRMARSALKEHSPYLKPGYDIIVIARPGAEGVEYDKLKALLENHLRRLRLLDSSS